MNPMHPFVVRICRSTTQGNKIGLLSVKNCCHNHSNCNYLGNRQTKFLCRGNSGVYSTGFGARNDLALHRHQRWSEGEGPFNQHLLAGFAISGTIRVATDPAQAGYELLPLYWYLNSNYRSVLLVDGFHFKSLQNRALITQLLFPRCHTVPRSNWIQAL